MKRIRSAAWSVLAFTLAAVITPFVVLWMYVTGPHRAGRRPAMELTTEPRARTWMEARTVICAVLILAVGEDEARRLMRLADMAPEAVAS